MKVPPKSAWSIVANGGEPRFAIDDLYSTAWTTPASQGSRLEIDLGAAATLGGLEVYWGRQAPTVYRVDCSPDGEAWELLCRTRHGEGGQDVFCFPPTEARFVRFVCEEPFPEQGLEVVEVNLYSPADAASVLEEGRVVAIGRGPVTLCGGESITVDFGYVRSPLVSKRVRTASRVRSSGILYRRRSFRESRSISEVQYHCALSGLIMVARGQQSPLLCIPSGAGTAGTGRQRQIDQNSNRSKIDTAASFFVSFRFQKK